MYDDASTDKTWEILQYWGSKLSEAGINFILSKNMSSAPKGGNSRILKTHILPLQKMFMPFNLTLSKASRIHPSFYPHFSKLKHVHNERFHNLSSDFIMYHFLNNNSPPPLTESD